ncbi:hypothetical protein BSL78_17161 [Apostichopus japonicus]|uniref:Uncharacterized protein n=1 Tax=Stichopus japonicus TaxID=307972 RepID=A0A2G8KD97_STIJA|nr:hypothetical protein BSL78_17161 [Apostichopus japonicus]
MFVKGVGWKGMRPGWAIPWPSVKGISCATRVGKRAIWPVYAPTAHTSREWLRARLKRSLSRPLTPYHLMLLSSPQCPTLAPRWRLPSPFRVRPLPLSKVAETASLPTEAEQDKTAEIVLAEWHAEQDAAFVLRLQLPESFHVEKGIWRLNTEIEQKLKEQFVEKYRGWQSLKPAFPNTIVWWDEVKSVIKQFVCVERAHQRRFKLHSLCNNRARDGSSSSDLNALGVFLDEKLHGARVRARIQFVEADEKPTIRFYRDVFTGTILVWSSCRARRQS